MLAGLCFLTSGGNLVPLFSSAEGYKNNFLDPSTQMKATGAFQTSGNTNSVTQHNFPEDLNP